MSNSFNSIVLILFTGGTLSCSDSIKVAPERNYYFEVKTNQNNTFNNELAAFLTENIPRKKYTITNQSGQIWPFYAALELDEEISRDSLMPPHWYLHKMIPRDLNKDLKIDDYFVRIDLMPQLNTIPNYRVEIYEMHSTGLTFLATSGIHYVDSTEFSSRLALSEHYLKSIIRYSFK